MEVIRPDAGYRPSERALAVARLIGALYLVTGVCLAWLTLATPFVAVFAARGRAFADETAFNTLGWLVAVALPATCLLVGAHRLVGFTELPNPFRTRRDPLAGLGSSLGTAYVAIRGLVLPGGRQIASVLVGPPGIVVLGQLPRAGQARPVGNHWEARVSDDEWIPIENPLERAARDAEAVRRWLLAEDHDFAIKVYAAVIASDQPVARTAATAVVERSQVATFLANLPPHRTFTADRRKQVLDRIRRGVETKTERADW
ncbi:MAG TPA: hypothetical protein VGJ17_04245 [Candidatus Limnocylindrales bacterium]